MGTRIKSIGEFLDKLEMATQIKKSIDEGIQTEHGMTIFPILSSELSEFEESGKLTKAKFDAYMAKHK